MWQGTDFSEYGLQAANREQHERLLEVCICVLSLSLSLCVCVFSFVYMCV